MPSGAPPPVQMMQLKFPSPGPSALDQLQGINKAMPGAIKGFGALQGALGGGGGPLPGEPGAVAEGPVALGGVSALPGTPGSASFGPAAPAQPAVAQGGLDVIRNLLSGLAHGQGQTAPLVMGPDSNGGGGSIPLDASLVGRAGLDGSQAPLLQALKGLDPGQILNMLKTMGQSPASPDPSTQGLPGSAAVNGAGLMPSTFGG